MKSRALSRNLKLKIYKSLIRPVVTYGCEAWTLYKEWVKVKHNYIIINM